jgi:hypothetical protein
VEVSKVFVSRSGQIKNCYQEAVQRTASLSGHVMLNVLVKSDGRVDHTSVIESDVADEKLHSCIGERICAWRFPASPNGTDFNFEQDFIFRPPEGGITGR